MILILRIFFLVSLSFYFLGCDVSKTDSKTLSIYGLKELAVRPNIVILQVNDVYFWEDRPLDDTNWIKYKMEIPQ